MSSRPEAAADPSSGLLATLGCSALDIIALKNVLYTARSLRAGV
ncbi:MAG: hypothetical protein ACOH1T_10435 [Microbacteriaceae bacterium]